MKLFFCSTVAIPLTVYSVYKIFLGDCFLAITFILTALLFIWIGLIEIYSIPEDGVLKLICGFIVVFSVLHSFTTSPATDMELTNNNFELFMQAAETRYCPIEVQPDNEKRMLFRSLKNVMLNTCGLENITNMQDLSINLGKAIHLDPVSGAVDSVYSDIYDEDEITCLDIAAELNKLCPGWTSF